MVWRCLLVAHRTELIYNVRCFVKLKALSQRSCNVLNELGPQIQWLQSYVTDDKLYCIYIAPNEEIVQEHARMGGFPANHVARVKTIIDPTTSEH